MHGGNKHQKTVLLTKWAQLKRCGRPILEATWWRFWLKKSVCQPCDCLQTPVADEFLFLCRAHLLEKKLCLQRNNNNGKALKSDWPPTIHTKSKTNWALDFGCHSVEHEFDIVRMLQRLHYWKHCWRLVIPKRLLRFIFAASPQHQGASIGHQRSYPCKAAPAAWLHCICCLHQSIKILFPPGKLAVDAWLFGWAPVFIHANIQIVDAGAHDVSLKFWSLPLGSFHHPTNSCLACYRADLFIVEPQFASTLLPAQPIKRWGDPCLLLLYQVLKQGCCVLFQVRRAFRGRAAYQAALLSICHFMGVGILVNLIIVIGILGSGVLQIKTSKQILFHTAKHVVGLANPQNRNKRNRSKDLKKNSLAFDGVNMHGHGIRLQKCSPITLISTVSGKSSLLFFNAACAGSSSACRCSQSWPGKGKPRSSSKVPEGEQ